MVEYIAIQMRIALLSLIGLFSFTVVCPVAMGAMPMDMEVQDMQHMMQSDGDDASSMPCEQCKKDKEEIAVAFTSPDEVVAPAGIETPFLVFWKILTSINDTVIQMAFLANAPPWPAETLVGTVILRT